jgi:phage terminase large subunit-like protein
VIDVMQTGMGTQLQPLLFEITTAGSLSNRESVWWAHRAYSVQLLERVLADDTWFALVVGADRDDDWTLEATWRKANPNYGVSVMADDLARKCDQAKAMPSYQNTFRRLHLGQLVEQDNRYVSMDQWTTPESCAPLDLERLTDRPCYGGLDLSTTTDLSAFVLVWLEDDGGFSVLPHFWVPEDGMDERARKDRVPYPAWARDGFLTATPGAVVDYGFIFETVKGLLERFQVKGIAFDRWNASHLVTMLMDIGAPMAKFGQGYVSMNQPTKELARQLAAGTLRHGGHPVLTWNASNMTVATDPAGNVKPDKGRAADRIDGMVAMVMGMALAGTSPTATSVYTSRGVRSLGDTGGEDDVLAEVDA